MDEVGPMGMTLLDAARVSIDLFGAEQTEVGLREQTDLTEAEIQEIMRRLNAGNN